MTPSEVIRFKERLAERPDLLARMAPDEQAAVATALVAYDDERYKNDVWGWAIDQVTTIDEASNELRKFPDWVYLRDLFQALDEIQLLGIIKSRRMFVTWAVSIYLLHRIRYRKQVAAYVQSEIESKAAYVINNRIEFVEQHLNPLYQRTYTKIRTSEGQTGFMKFDLTGSYAKGLAQGSDAFRTFTPSIVFMDEIEFMPEGHQSFVAALPFAEKKCQIILCSTSNGPSGVLAGMAREAGFKKFA